MSRLRGNEEVLRILNLKGGVLQHNLERKARLWGSWAPPNHHRVRWETSLLFYEWFKRMTTSRYLLFGGNSHNDSARESNTIVLLTATNGCPNVARYRVRAHPISLTANANTTQDLRKTVIGIELVCVSSLFPHERKARKKSTKVMQLGISSPLLDHFL